MACVEVAKKLDRLLRCDELRRHAAKQLFESHAEAGRLRRDDMVRFGDSFARSLDVDLRAPRRGLAPVKRAFKKLLQFERVDLMFQRFDINGDGFLDYEEVCSLFGFMLRVAREAVGVPQAGVEKVDGRLRRARKNLVKERFGSVANWVKIGKGGQGATFLATEISSGMEVVLKRYESHAGDETEADGIAEFELLKSLKHPRIEHIYDIFRTREHVYIVKEPYYGGDLRDAVFRASNADVKVGERWLSGVFHQVLEGVHYLHNSYIVHCDLKEANVMLASNDLAVPQVKVIDFGLAFRFDGNLTWRGSPRYMPPEAVKHGIWTPRGDVFSVGVMLFVMATGDYPYSTELDGAPSMTGQSPALTNLAHRMVDRNLERRPAIRMILCDEWFKHRQDDRLHLADHVLKKISATTHESTMRRALLAKFAQRMHLGQLGRLNDFFVDLDEDDDGIVTEQEMRDKLRGAMLDSEIQEVVQHFMGKDGKMGYHEFIGKVIAENAIDETEVLREIFNEADTNSDGFLDESEVSRLLDDKTVEGIVSRVGSSKNAEMMEIMRAAGGRGTSGQIDFAAFAHVVQTGGMGIISGSSSASVATSEAASPMRAGAPPPAYTKGELVRLTSKRMGLVNAFRFSRGRHRYMRLMNQMLGQEYLVQEVEGDMAAVRPSWLHTVSGQSHVWLPMRALKRRASFINGQKRSSQDVRVGGGQAGKTMRMA